MKTTAFAALLAPLALLIALIGMVLLKSHAAPAAISTSTSSTILMHRHAVATAPATPITTLPTITVYAGVKRTSAVRHILPLQSSWCTIYCDEPTDPAAFAMPYYSFGTSVSAADKG